MPGSRQLLRTRKPRRTRAYDRDAFAAALRRQSRLDPAFPPAAVDNRAFDRLYGDRIVVNIERARRLARRRANASGELRKIVGRVQGFQRRPPLIAIDEVVPIRDQVVDRATFMAERNAAIHAASR